MLKTFEAIVLMTLVTYGSRSLPLLLLRRSKIEGFAKEFIELVPVALLAALVVPELIIPDGQRVTLVNPFLGAGVLTFFFSKYVPNLFAGVTFGMVVFWALNSL